MPRRAAAALASLVAAGGLLLGACGSSGAANALARQACVHVQRSISLYESSNSLPTASAILARRAQATSELNRALPLAARATSADGQWNGLMTTISEIARVSESHLIPALKLQCAAADTNQPLLPSTPTTFPPAP